ncbi:MAG: 50S ribosomal protein L25 [Vicinamibacteria bacterium]|jgi:large subunit ribosomal protein L25|nr:50S ribosomal protein L25 [Vicinamibacteria bacterium]
MAEIVVAAQSRTETGKNANNRLRASGMIPGVLYGSTGQAPVPVAVSPKQIGAILRTGRGESTLFALEIGTTSRKVVLKDYQVDPVKGALLHADFYEVDLKKPISVKVHVVLHGTAVGVKTEGGFLEFITREVEVSCLPTEIPEKIDIDVSDLTIGKNVRVADLKMGDKVKVLTHEDVVIVHVIGKREEEVVATPEAAVAAAPAGSEPEVIKKGKLEAEGDAKKDDKKKEKK